MVEVVTGAVDFADIVLGIGTIAGALAVAMVAGKGAKMLLSHLRGG